MQTAVKLVSAHKYLEEVQSALTTSAGKWPQHIAMHVAMSGGGRYGHDSKQM